MFRQFLTMLVLSTVLLISANGQNYDSLIQEGQKQMEAANYQAAAEKFEQAIALNNQDEHILYQAAVAFAMAKHSAKSIAFLKQALDKGIDDVYYSNLRFDDNFNGIKHTKEWKAFYSALLTPFDEAALNIPYPEIRQELLRLYYAEQNLRRRITGRGVSNELASAIEANDRYHARKLEMIVDQIGWPTISKVGKDGAHAAWSIIQHAVFNPILMRKCLELMKPALEAGDIDGVDYAYLYDRFCAVGTLAQQRYGILRNLPIEDEYEINERRKAMGFEESLAAYRNDPDYSPPSQAEVEARNQELAQQYQSNIQKANALMNAGNYEEASAFFKEALKCNGFIEDEAIYNVARLYANSESRGAAFRAVRYLRCLVARGFNDAAKLENDPTLDNLKENKLWKELISIIKRYHPE